MAKSNSFFTPKIIIRSSTIRKDIVAEKQIDEIGSAQIADFYSARIFTHNLKQKFNKEILPGRISSFALLTEIFNYILHYYDTEVNQNSFFKINVHIQNNLDIDKLYITLKDFINEFPIKDLIIQGFQKDDIINSYILDDIQRKKIYIKLILVYLSNLNTAAEDFRFLFDDSILKEKTSYTKLLNLIEDYFEKEKRIPITNQTLFEFLKTPLLANPNSLEQQILFIKEKWAPILPAELIEKILITIDYLKEESKIFQIGFGPGEIKTPIFSLEELLGLGDKLNLGFYKDVELEQEKFTPDTDWMPKVVMLAKNIYVWLYQLSKKYNREIEKLNEIPDEELDQLVKWNINALWLIGIWERSSASKKIKQLTGNPEALSSAYSIFDYEIAKDLGGEEAFQNLDRRCRERGIRLASDMVPNHMGIFSRWIIEHPDYFIQSEVCPFPNYSFTGPDLSDDPRIQIRIEDGYYTRKDAAVVFQLIENSTGKVRYIYHGNDGTNMPWNDTAQLNFLRPEVREAVIKLIFHVAEKFSIIRLDAAMTLTQKHYQRLWFPLPGTGGAIPTRADYSMTNEEFRKSYPKEFWREVVDRINTEKPNTLLLAEAFWLLEGYFVRTLGMHRVYNSAFMHMLKNEENQKYRDLIVKTLEFNPQILKRYVNFMSNPDEETAINQFGDGDKYFGVCTMMVTLPGLPMFAHGQIEGLREKYGHEYWRAYYDEVPNQYLIERHEKEIFPLLKKRYLFSDVENFEFYDFKNNDEKVIENVFAYSNYVGEERVLVFYNNSIYTYTGKIFESCYKNRASSDEIKDLKKKILGQALNLPREKDLFCIFREHPSNLEYLRPVLNFFEQPFTLKLKGYEYKVFCDFRFVKSKKEILDLYNEIGDKGVPSVTKALEEKLIIEYSHVVFNFMSNIKKYINEYLVEEKYIRKTSRKKEEPHLELSKFLQNVSIEIPSELKISKMDFLSELSEFANVLKELSIVYKKFSNKPTKYFLEFNKKVGLLDDPLGELFYQDFPLLKINLEYSQISQEMKDKVLIYTLNEIQKSMDNKISGSLDIAKLFKVLSVIDSKLTLQITLEKSGLIKLFLELLKDKLVMYFLNVHQYENEKYFIQEHYEVLEKVYLNFIIRKYFKEKIIKFKKATEKGKEFRYLLKNMIIVHNSLIDSMKISQYKYDKLIEELEKLI